MAVQTVTLSDGTTTVTFSHGCTFERDLIKIVDVHERAKGTVRARDRNRRTQQFSISGTFTEGNTGIVPEDEETNLYAISDKTDAENTLTLTKGSDTWTVRVVHIHTTGTPGAGSDVGFTVKLVEDN